MPRHHITRPLHMMRYAGGRPVPHAVRVARAKNYLKWLLKRKRVARIYGSYMRGLGRVAKRRKYYAGAA